MRAAYLSLTWLENVVCSEGGASSIVSPLSGGCYRCQARAIAPPGTVGYDATAMVDTRPPAGAYTVIPVPSPQPPAAVGQRCPGAICQLYNS
jgi:hypothetical protein